MEMKFLICLLFPLSALAQDKYCREYTLDIGELNVASDSTCYVSGLTKEHRKYIVTISTTKYSNRFAVLRSFPIKTHVYTGTLTFAVILGEPDQLYVIREESGSVGGDYYYFFSLRPIEQSDRMNRRIHGRVLEVSNIKICDESI